MKVVIKQPTNKKKYLPNFTEFESLTYVKEECFICTKIFKKET